MTRVAGYGIVLLMYLDGTFYPHAYKHEEVHMGTEQDGVLELRLHVDFWQPVNWVIEGAATTDCPACRRKMIPIHSILQTNDQGFTPAVFGYCEGCGQLYLGRTK